MGLTRKALVAMGIDAEKIDQIIEMHTEVVDAIKSERDTAQGDVKKYKADADKLVIVEKELNELKAEGEKPDEYKKKYDDLKKEYDDYKGEITAKETKAAKCKAYREMLKDVGVSDKRLDSVMKVADINSVELDESGAIKGVDELKASVKEEWADFIVSEGRAGANTPKPPANVGGNKMTKDQIMQIKDTEARQKAMLENAEVFGI
jgi:DNA repair exonuclease SbcCD ATPase subunit